MSSFITSENKDNKLKSFNTTVVLSSDSIKNVEIMKFTRSDYIWFNEFRIEISSESLLKPICFWLSKDSDSTTILFKVRQSSETLIPVKISLSENYTLFISNKVSDLGDVKKICYSITIEPVITLDK